MVAQAGTVTLLFTDLVNSTELLQRAGDEHAQRIFQAHHRMLRQAVDHHGGHEVKWLGDGLMVSFTSAADALRCAVRMQQAAYRPAAGERLQIRVGLNAGEALRDESDYFGTPVVVARRLCDRAQAGQILASELVTRLLEGRQEFVFESAGDLELKGIAEPVSAVEVVYEHDPLALLARTPFVGRKDEMAVLEQALVGVRGGHGAVVMLSGEPGIGKTRLAEEFSELAHGAGATVVRGGCYEGDISAPYRPWVEALREYVRAHPGNDLRYQLGPGAPEVAALLPELRQRFPDIEVAPKLDPEAERFRLFDSVTQFVRSASASNGALVVLLDDLHWADKPSLLLLQHIARHGASDRLLLLGTYRDVELGSHHPLAEMLAELRRLEHAQRVGLGGLAEETVEELLSVIEPSEELAEARHGLAMVLYQQTEGNPFFIREVLNHLVETGQVVREGGRWMGGVASVEELGIPESVREVIGRRLSRLSDGCNRMLTRASAMTGGFTWEELKAVCEEPEEQLLDFLDEALGARLIAERPGQPGLYTLTHALIRQTLYEQLNTPRRLLLHRQIGEALERLYIEPHLAELAHHFLRAAPSAPEHVEKAVDYATRAGDRGMALFAWEEAAGHYERALEALELGATPNETQRCELALRIGEAQVNAAQPQQSMETYRQAAAVARTLHDAELLTRAAVGFEEAANSVFGDMALRREALALVDEALAALPSEESPRRARVAIARVRPAAALAGGGQDLFRSGGFGGYAGVKDLALVAQAREALAMAERLNDGVLTAAALATLHSYVYGPGNAQERLAMTNEQIRLATQAGSVIWEAWGRDWRLMDLLELCDMAAFHKELERYARLTKDTRQEYHAWVVLAVRAMLATAEGRLGEAEQLALDALQQGQEAGGPDTVTAFGGQLFALRWLQGRLAEVEPVFRDAAERSPNITIYPSCLALIYCELGRMDEARDVVGRLGGHGFTDIPQDFVWLGTITGLVEACSTLRDAESAEALYNLLLPYADLNVTVVHVVSFGAASRTLGLLATVMGRWEEAERHFQDAIEMNTRMGFHPWVAMTQLNYARMLLARKAAGDDEKAGELLHEALEAANRMGMAKVTSDCRALRAQLST